MRIVLFALLLLTLTACGASTPAVTPDSAMAAFKAAGLNVNNVTTTGVLIPEVANAAPTCQGVRFDVEGDNGARVIVCGSTSDAEKVATYYRSLGESNALFFSHVHAGGPLVFQMNGVLDKALFEKYVAALP